MKKIEYTLIDNSISFFIDSLEKAIRSEDEPYQWKFAIFSLIQAIELSIKECLRKEHEIFIFSNIDSPKHTVSIDVAMKRLSNLQQIEISDEDKRFIEIARTWRNSIVHHRFEFSLNLVKTVFSGLLGFYSHFLQMHLNKTISSYLSAELWNEVLKIDDYLNELRARAQERIENEKIDSQFITYCPKCNENMLVANHNKHVPSIIDGTCYVCNHIESVMHCEICAGLFAGSRMEYIHRKSPNGDRMSFFVCKDYCLAKFN